MARATDKFIAQNRRARHDYFIDETLEAGIVLTGTEVKSLRDGKASLNESYATDRGGEIWLLGANIPAYPPAAQFNHDPKRARKLLLRKREMNKLLGASVREGATIVPLSLYFSPRGIAKVEIGVARGKKKHDKRQSMKDRDWKRDKARIMKARG